MRKLISYFLVFSVLVIAFSLSTGVGFAQTTGETGNPALDDPDVFTFRELGYTERYMVGPYDIIDLFFSIPDNWELVEGTYIQLEFSFSSGGAGTTLKPENWIGGTLLVRYNNEVVSSVLLVDDDLTSYQIPVTLAAFDTDSDDGRHHIRFFLDASMHCDNEEELDTIVWIEPESYVKFVYTQKGQTNELSKFPRPFYLPDSIVPAAATVVIPSAPTSAEIESGLAIAAGLGSVTNGESQINLKELGNLTEEEKSGQHLIFVGPPDKFPDLAGVYFPVSITGKSFDLPADKADDGVIQLVTSPWNPIKSILFVSGNNAEAVVKAAKAVSSGKIVPSGLSNVSLVSEVTSTSLKETSIVDRSLADMGFTTATVGIYGDAYYDIAFYATAEQARSEGAYFDIVSTRSNLLDFDRSGVTLLLNGEVVGTLGYSAGESKIITERFELLPNFIRRGQNRLEIITSLLPYDLCYTTDLEATWVTISDTSAVHLPTSERQTVIGERLDFGLYPLMFLGDNQFSNLAFVLPGENSAAIEAAAQLAYFLGNQETLAFADFDVYFPDEVTDEILSSKNLVFFGRATELPLLSDINDKLPGSFDEDSDIANEPPMPVNFSVLPDVAVGYTQLLPSPWNPDNSLLLVMGNSDAGVLMSKDALTTSALIGDLAGNYATVFGDQILTVDTRLGSDVTVVAVDQVSDDTGGEEPAATQPVLSPAGAVESRPKWLVPTMLGTSALMLIFIIIVAVRSRLRNR